MSVTIGTALAIGGIATAGAGVASSVIGSKAAGKASEQQAQSGQAAIDEQRRQFDISNENSQPFVKAGQTSISQLMEQIAQGKFGAGSTGNIPNDFKAPTLEEVRDTPGYQFAAQQGSKGILQGAAAAGGAISGGTLRALDSFNTGLADSTYQNAFNRSLSTYQAQLAGYGSRLAGQQQEFGQLVTPALIGSGSTASLNTLGQNSANTISGLMQGIGNANAAGTVGGANAITSGISGAANGISDSLLLGQLIKKNNASPNYSTNDAGVLIG